VPTFICQRNALCDNIIRSRENGPSEDLLQRCKGQPSFPACLLPQLAPTRDVLQCHGGRDKIILRDGIYVVHWWNNTTGRSELSNSARVINIEPPICWWVHSLGFCLPVSFSKSHQHEISCRLYSLTCFGRQCPAVCLWTMRWDNLYRTHELRCWILMHTT